MQIKENKIDDLNMSLNITLDKADWAEQKKKKLNNYRRNAEIKGFRKGMAPMSLIERFYGAQAMGETINSIIGETLNKYIDDNKLHIIGEPLPSEKEIENDWDNAETHTFEYDLGLYPEFTIDVTKEDKIPYYKVKISDEAKAEYKSNLLKQFGNMVDGEKMGAEDFMLADFEQGETKVENTYVALRSMANDDVKKPFIGLKAGDSIDVNVMETFANDTDRAAMLRLTKDEVAAMEPVWKLTVKSIKTFVDAEENQETFDKIYGEGVVKSAEEFDKKVAESMAAEYAQESGYKFNLDAKDYLVKKADIKLPEEFLKRWLLEANEGKFTKEDIEKEFDMFLVDFKWDLVRTEIMKAHDLKITKEAMEQEARNFINYQYSMYGMMSVPEDMMKDLVNKILTDQEQSRRIFEKVENDIVCSFAKKNATLSNKSTTLEKLRDMLK
ncbi:MAG: trigger factor [Bacteroidales bacterium]|nr:trigger factor [Candidatus Equibacterium intestinale]